MNKNSRKLYIGIFITIVIFIVVIFIYAKEKKEIFENVIQESAIPSSRVNNEIETQTLKSAIEKETEKNSENPKNKEDNRESVTVLAGETNIHLSFAPDTSFYDTLVQAKSAGQIEFAGKNYPGLGFFVTDIGTLHAGRGKYLLYYVNGKEASVGVSSYTLKDGDIIEWKLE